MRHLIYESALTQLEWGERNDKVETFYRLTDEGAEFIHFCTECEHSSYSYDINGIDGCEYCKNEKTATEVAA